MFDTLPYLLVGAIIFLIWYFFAYNYRFDMVYATASLDGNRYLVRNLPDKEKAANMIAYVRSMLTFIVNRLKLAYPNDNRVKLLSQRYKADKIEESSEDSKHTSYSVNKGEVLVFCLRFRNDKRELVSKNTITFVALHELAHVITISHGHTQEFWNSFRFLLAHAIKWGIYKNVDYRKNKEPYCGTVITDTPYVNGDINKFVSFDDKKIDFSSVPLPIAYEVHPDESVDTF